MISRGLARRRARRRRRGSPARVDHPARGERHPQVVAAGIEDVGVDRVAGLDDDLVAGLESGMSRSGSPWVTRCPASAKFPSWPGPADSAKCPTPEARASSSTPSITGTAKSSPKAGTRRIAVALPWSVRPSVRRRRAHARAGGTSRSCRSSTPCWCRRAARRSSRGPRARPSTRPTPDPDATRDRADAGGTARSHALRRRRPRSCRTGDGVGLGFQAPRSRHALGAGRVPGQRGGHSASRSLGDQVGHPRSTSAWTSPETSTVSPGPAPRVMISSEDPASTGSSRG